MGRPLQGRRSPPDRSATTRPSATSPATTRATRAGSSGHPDAEATRLDGDRSRPEGGDQATPALPVRAAEPTLGGRRHRPSPARDPGCGRPAPPTGSGGRTGQLAQQGWPATQTSAPRSSRA